MAPTTEPLIRAEKLTKRFGAFVAVDGIDFTVERGEAFGFLGPNGAGKSSTMRMIGCVSPVSGGTLRIFDLDPGARWHRDPGPPRRGAAAGLARRRADRLREPRRVRPLLRSSPIVVPRRVRASCWTSCSCATAPNSRVEPLSGGMKRRLTIARSLMSEPEMLLLDEPTTGLDPQARHLVWDRLYRLKQRGVTLVLTTHYMDEAEQLCDRLVIMDNGRIVDEGSPRQLIERHITREVLELRFNGRRGRRRIRSAIWSTRAERCPTGCCCTPMTASRRSSTCTSATCGR